MTKSLNLAGEFIGSTLKGAGGATVKGMVNACGKQVGRSVLKGSGRLAGRIAPALSVVEFGFDQAETVAARRRGDISEREYETRTVGNVSSAAGSLGGGWGGAAIGTVFCPGVGTLIGAVLGSWLGSSAGRGVGESFWEW